MMRDVLADVLNSLRLVSSVYCRSELASPWGLHFAAANGAVFHVLYKGSGTLTLDDAPDTHTLRSGDIVLIADGSAHTITDQTDQSGMLSLPDVRIGQHGDYSLLRWSEQPTVVLLCGSCQVEADAFQPLFTLLPRVLHIPGENDRPSRPFANLLQIMDEEASADQPGAALVLRRAADMLLIQLIRQWLATQNNERHGWLSALHDPQINQTLHLIHSNPEYGWTIAALAGAVALSRSTLAARFTSLVGEPPLRYLTRWRLYRAKKLLKESDLTLAAIAHQVGYASEYAFSKAFKRELGLPPGTYRTVRSN